MARNDVLKKMIMMEMVAGSMAGGYLPALFRFDGLMVSLSGGFIGGITGIGIGYNFFVWKMGEKTLGLERTDRINRRISNDYGNGPTGMAAFQAQERP